MDYPYHTTSSLTNPVYQPARAGHPSTPLIKAVSTGQHVVGECAQPACLGSIATAHHPSRHTL
jgi:hypothetical protein